MRVSYRGYLLVASIALMGMGCQHTDSKSATVSGEVSRASVVTSAAPYQAALLDLAMDTASAIPIDPHIKERSKSQESVVEACLELGLFPQAQRGTEQVKDWRRGTCYADLAQFQARHGGTDMAKYLDKAELIANAQGLEAWRRDTIRVKIAEAHVWMGNNPQAKRIEADLTSMDSTKLVAVRAVRGDELTFDAEFGPLNQLAADKNLDVSNGALQSAVNLYDRFYINAGQRAAVEKLIRSGWTTFPIFLKIEYLLQLCDAARTHKDLQQAMTFVEEAERMKDGAKWPIEYETPLNARLAEYRYRAGDRTKARASLKETLAKYEANKQYMLNIERVSALIPVAEAYQAISDREGALSVYKRATEEGVVNPNSRPRAMDLTAICRSMALRGVEPDKVLWARLREIRRGLSDPW